MPTFDRITQSPDRLGGAAAIRDTRISAATVAGMRSAGMSDREIVAELPGIDLEDIAQAVAYVAQTEAQP